MKRSFESLDASHFPGVDSQKFMEWKHARIAYLKKVRTYYLIIGPLALGSVIVINAIKGFTAGWPVIAVLSALAYVVAMFIARNLPRRDDKKLAEELGITEEQIQKVLSGGIITRDDIEKGESGGSAIKEKPATDTEQSDKHVSSSFKLGLYPHLIIGILWCVFSIWICASNGEYIWIIPLSLIGFLPYIWERFLGNLFYRSS